MLKLFPGSPWLLAWRPNPKQDLQGPAWPGPWDPFSLSWSQAPSLWFVSLTHQADSYLRAFALVVLLPRTLPSTSLNSYSSFWDLNLSRAPWRSLPDAQVRSAASVLCFYRASLQKNSSWFVITHLFGGCLINISLFFFFFTVNIYFI